MLSASRRNLSQRCSVISTLNIAQGQSNVNGAGTVMHMKHHDTPTMTRTTTYQRLFSSNMPYGGTPMGPLRSQPQYAIFGEKTMLSIKMIPPTFRCLKNGSLVLDQNKKGRILLEWSPRGDSGKFL
jgi:hypothetical protein